MPQVKLCSVLFGVFFVSWVFSFQSLFWNCAKTHTVSLRNSNHCIWWFLKKYFFLGEHDVENQTSQLTERYKAGMFVAAPGARGIAPPNLHTAS